MKTLISFFLCVILSTSLIAAETLSFKFTNPHIEVFAPDNYLVFDILVKASANGTYLYASQVICSISLANFNTTVSPTANKGAFLAGTYDPPGPTGPIEKYSVSSNYNSGNLNISVLSNASLKTYLVDGHSEVTTSWQTLCTVYCVISNTSGSAGIAFQPASMNGYQKYATGVSPLYSDYYVSPNQYEGYDFTDLYLARMYCGTYGWSQVGLGAGANWTSSVNTSVWDIATNAAFVGDASHPNALANGLRIHPAGKLAINPATTLTVANTLTNSAGNTGLLIKSDATGTGSLLHYTDNVAATIQRYIQGSADLTIFKYHFVSIPLLQTENPTSNLFLGSYLFDFNEGINNWHGLGAPTITNLYSNKGYMIYYPNTSITYSFAGKMNNGAFSAPVTKTGQGYNLVPNPYPSAIDWDATSGWTKNGVESAVYVWLSTVHNYASYVGGVSQNNGSRYIAQGQSFFVHAPASTSIGMNNDIRVHNSIPFLKENEIIPNLLRIGCATDNETDEIVVRFTGLATTGFDSDFDAYKLQGGAEAPQFNSVANDNSKLCINSLPYNTNETVVPLNFSFSSAGEISFTASGMETFTGSNPIYLEDQQLGSMTNLREIPVYTFNYEPGNDENRFKLHFSSVTGIGEQPIPTSGNAFLAADKLYVEVPSMQGQKTEITVYNILGQQLKLMRRTMNGLIEVPFDLSSGVYVVRVTSSSQVFVTKIVKN